jgi:DNA-binding NtrC family response regulator
LGRGSTFRVCLPAANGPVFAKSKEDSSIESGVGCVLLMDDEPDIRGIAQQMLEHLGYQVCPVSDGSEAVEAFSDAIKGGSPFDVVVVDLTVPGGMGAVETVERLMSLDPRVRAIVSSGYSNDPVLSEFERYGFCAMVAKPFNLHELAKAVRNAMLARRHSSSSSIERLRVQGSKPV